MFTCCMWSKILKGMMEEVPDNAISNALKFLRTEAEKKSGLLDGAQRINLRINLFKLPATKNTNSKQVKVELKHQLPHRDVCLIVADGANRKNRANIEDTIEHYEEMFRKAGVTGIQEIIPVLRLKLDYQNYEAKRNFASRYDTVMADSRIVRFLPSMLGKNFYGNKRYPLQVDLTKGVEGLAARFQRYMNTHICPISVTGVGSSMVVGQLDMTDEQVVDNVQAAIEKIVDSVPGGGQNIFSLNLSLDNTPLIPIYISSVDRSLVPVPNSADWMEEQKKAETVEGEISTVKGTVSISPDGVVTVTRPDGTKDVIGIDKTSRVKTRRTKRKVSKLSLKRNTNTPKATRMEDVTQGHPEKTEATASIKQQKHKKSSVEAEDSTSEQKTGKQSTRKRKVEHQDVSLADGKSPKISSKSPETSSLSAPKSKRNENSKDHATPAQPTKLSTSSKKTPLKPQNSPLHFNSGIDKPSQKSPKVVTAVKAASPKTPAVASPEQVKSSKNLAKNPLPKVEEEMKSTPKSGSKKKRGKLVPTTPSSVEKVMKKPSSATKPSPVRTRSQRIGAPAKAPSKPQNSAVKKPAKKLGAVKD